jgi:hypothetical protein
MPSAGFKLATPASERPQTLALDGAATGIGFKGIFEMKSWLQIQGYSCLIRSKDLIDLLG